MYFVTMAKRIIKLHILCDTCCPLSPTRRVQPLISMYCLTPSCCRMHEGDDTAETMTTRTVDGLSVGK
jgi:hypothetical protein